MFVCFFSLFFWGHDLHDNNHLIIYKSTHLETLKKIYLPSPMRAFQSELLSGTCRCVAIESPVNCVTRRIPGPCTGGIRESVPQPIFGNFLWGVIPPSHQGIWQELPGLLAIRRDNGASPAVKGWLVRSAGKDLTKVTKATSSTCRRFPQRPVHPDSCKSLLSFCRWVIFWSLPKEVGWALCYSYFGSHQYK